MVAKLKKELESINEGILLHELNDHANRREYAELKKRKRLLIRSIRKMERLSRKNEV